MDTFNVFPGLSGCLRWCGSQAGTGLIVFRNLARTDGERGGCPDQKLKGSLSLSYLSLLLIAITGLHPQL